MANIIDNTLHSVLDKANVNTILHTSKGLLDSPILKGTLLAVGTFWTLGQLSSLTSFLYVHFLRRSSLSRYKKTSGNNSAAAWALVTGASDGIGKGFADELCNRGFNVVIHGRNEKKLQGVRDQLLKQWPKREIRLLVIDAANEAGDAAKLEAAVKPLRDLNLKVLINNVGGSGGMKPSWLEATKSSAERVRLHIDLNLRFPTEFTRILLPQLVRQSPALVLNIGSLVGEVPTPYLSTYAGAKAFNKAWSRSINLEMKLEGHDVESKLVLVGMVSSGSEPRELEFLVPSSRGLAKGALDKVGYGSDVVYGYWPHQFQYWAFSHMPQWLFEREVGKIMKTQKDKEAKSM